jgi:hypothetical protein
LGRDAGGYNTRALSGIPLYQPADQAVRRHGDFRAGTFLQVPRLKEN